MDSRVPPAVLTLAGMIATPLLRPRGRGRRSMANVVVAGLAVTTAAATKKRWGAGPTARAAAVVTGLTAVVERVGTGTGVPFGGYSYTGALRPTVGGVPAIVPLAWFAMAVPAREAGHAALGNRSTPASRVVLGAAALTAWDLFLDPQMVAEGYWAWSRRGTYRGIPVSNFVGWFATGLAVMVVLERMLPPGTASDGPDGTLVGEYGAMAVMETLGFAAFFRDRLVAAVGGAAMLPVAVAALRRFR